VSFYSLYLLLSVFSHIAQLTQGTPAHNALHCQVGLASDRSLGDVVLVVLTLTGQTNDTGSVPANLWRQAILQGHGGVTRLPELAVQWRRLITVHVQCICSR